MGCTPVRGDNPRALASELSYVQVDKHGIIICPPVRGDNPQALASGLSYVHVDNHGISILYHLH